MTVLPTNRIVKLGKRWKRNVHEIMEKESDSVIKKHLRDHNVWKAEAKMMIELTMSEGNCYHIKLWKSCSLRK